MKRHADVAVVWGDLPPKAGVPKGGPGVVRVERTDERRPFFAVGWVGPRDRPKARPVARIVGAVSEHARRGAWADYLALGYVVGRAALEGEQDLDAVARRALLALPATGFVRVEPPGVTPAEPTDDTIDLFGSDDSDEAGTDEQEQGTDEKDAEGAGHVRRV